MFTEVIQRLRQNHHGINGTAGSSRSTVGFIGRWWRDVFPTYRLNGDHQGIAAPFFGLQRGDLTKLLASLSMGRINGGSSPTRNQQ